MNTFKVYRLQIVVIVLGVLLPFNIIAESSKFIICTQNLQLFGKAIGGLRPQNSNIELKAKLLAERFQQAKCDLIAVQEILAGNISDSNKNLAKISAKLNLEESKKFRSLTMDDYGSLRLGLIYNQEKFSIINTPSVRNYLLPKFSRYEKNSYFTRTPFLSLFLHRDTGQKFLLVNVHMKSASVQSGYDLSGYQFEIERMKAAQAISDIIDEEADDDSYIKSIIIGDFNAEMQAASARILRKELSLELFKNGVCQLAENGKADCFGKQNSNFGYVSLADSSREKLSGTFFRKKQFRLIDEILISKDAFVNPKKWDDGYIQAAPDVSDHPLLWSEVFLNQIEQ